ncbi:hypothetical protein [Tranquillimonas alkanivorans]|uniref:Uncharacterized protein n=1 Tax=Tranquillimonas alkanivorans TaxID=441119 RepID=A0A1I5R7B1_9RHOB|nr:hypothetical protein [Tranquillimonas alkanivorans]SFP54412.1 hypothetical protein SAMN04488047_10830 [Tranquillimonas alkanivorans]
MNVNGLVIMLVRTVMRKLVGKGVDYGIDRMSGGRKTRSEMTKAERQQAQRAKQTVKRARNAARLVRRLK